MKPVLAGVCLFVLLPAVLPGQTATNPPAFEVADVHVSPPGTPASDGGFMPGGRFELRGATMLALISQGYGVDSSMVIGGPAWLNSDKFDVIAKAPPGTVSEETLQAMLKTLLADRFKLVTHEARKDMPVYVLTVEKKGKLRPAAKDGPPETSRGTGDPGLNNHLVCQSFTMADLAQLLPQVARNFVNYPVVDETGLKGSFDFQLDWMGKGVYNAAKANPDGPPAVSAFNSVEKLGLKLEAAKRPLPVVMVDSVNQTPSPNPRGVTAKIPTFPTEFDVAEVRPAKSPAAGVGPLGQVSFENGRVTIMAATLKGLISLAFDSTMDRIAGAPKWMEEDRFDIIAKTPPTAPWDAMRGMLKTLLVQHFKLATHTEDQPMPVYVLSAGKKPRLKESDGTARSECKIVNTDKRYYVCQNTTMAQFAERLPTVSAAYIHPPLLDLTTLAGAYDFQVYWTPRKFLPGTPGQGDSAPPAAAEASTPTDDVTVFEAVDKQLGLKLEEQKHPIPVLVIDHADQTPSDQ